MVRRGLVDSRNEASRLIESALVLVAGAVADKTSRLVGTDEPIIIRGEGKRFVGRGGEKLQHALMSFAIDVTARHVVDAGSSTGGFTDCLLQNGAAGVAAFDVGRAQMHERLVNDPRVVQRDGFNVRYITTDDLPFPCSLLVADLSFISLDKVLEPLIAVLTSEGVHQPECVVLVKPQFELGRHEVSKGKGVVTDPVAHQMAVDGVRRELERLRWHVSGVIESPIKGAEGNTEFLVHAMGAEGSGGTQSGNRVSP